MKQEKNIVMNVILSIVTCGIYGIYWAYKMGKMIEQAQKNYGLPAKDNSIMYLVLEVVGLGIVAYCLMQNDLNEIIRTTNAGQAPATM